jgi:hypothetical protein
MLCLFQANIGIRCFSFSFLGTASMRKVAADALGSSPRQAFDAIANLLDRSCNGVEIAFCSSQPDSALARATVWPDEETKKGA